MTAVLEKTDLKLGYIPLTDCAVLAVAREKGFFAKHGLNVALSREVSWANIRDKVMVGALDGAHMLAPMPLAATLGLGSPVCPMIAALSLGLNGNAVTVSNALYRDMAAARYAGGPVSARALDTVISDRKHSGKPLLTFATVFPFSMHNYTLRYWLAAGGIHPDRDMRIIVVPPPQMADELASGAIDGFCVGEPWNQAAVTAGIGRVVITGCDIWNNAPEKVFGVARAWAEENPRTLAALVRAMLEAAQWLDRPLHREEAADLLARYIDLPADVIAAPLLGAPRVSLDGAPRTVADFNVFHRYSANFPWVSHAVWCLSQMYRWGQLTAPCDITAVACGVYRPDLFRSAAAALGFKAPSGDMKREGGHADPWTLNGLTLGPDRFCDGRRFDPAKPDDYLEGFGIHSVRTPLRDLARLAHGVAS